MNYVWDQKITMFCQELQRISEIQTYPVVTLSSTTTIRPESTRVKRGEYGAALKCRGGEPGDLRENPPTNDIVRYDSRVRKSGSDPAEKRTRFALVGGESSTHYTAAAPSPL
ncbi:hypothetical protein PR048_029253 [Dryococelus australis]|uniref:Uncharacterized protein n=1 Tax=Dryococelus australis TaxID=614101 RepID=A0ABQ9GCV1_9NEOP|nr:hypothetical protein PR048_029253 [Dryococelus australis]